MKMKRLASCLTCAAMIGTLIFSTGCGSSSKSSATDANGLKVLKFGVSAPLTGAYSKTGIETKDAVTLALEECNYQVGNYKLEPVWIDDQGDPQAGVKAYEQAIVKDKIQCSLFCNFSSVAIAEMEIAAKYQIPHFCSWGSSSIVNEKWATDDKYKVWLKGFAEPTKMSVAYIDAIENMIDEGKWTPSAKKFYVYGEDNDWGRAVGTGMGAEFESRGWEKVGEDYFKSGETDFYSLLSKMKSSGATVLLGTINAASSSSSFVKQAREVDVPALIVCEAASEIGDFYELTGDASNGLIDCRASYLVDPEKGAEFEQKFKDEFGYETSCGNGGYSYECFKYWMSVVEATDAMYGDVTSETLKLFSIDQIQTGKYVWKGEMVMPSIQYSAESDPDPVVSTDAFYNPVLQFQDGKTYVVYPTDKATKEFTIPDYVK